MVENFNVILRIHNFAEESFPITDVSLIFILNLERKHF